jgi:hypothetical protein
MKRALLPLLKQGIGDEETLDTVATIATDMAARTAGGISDVQQTIGAFAGIFQKGRLKPQALAEFGIKAEDYFAQLGAAVGVDAEKAAKMAKAGKISGDKLAAIAAHMVAAREGVAIGAPTLRSADTLGATLQRLGAAKENLFEKLSDSAGMKAVQGALDNIIELAQGPVGAQLIAKIGGAFEHIFGPLTGPEGKAKLEEIATIVGDKIGGAIEWVGNKAPKIIEVFEMLPGILDKAVTAAEIFAAIWAGGKVVSVISGLASALPLLGTAAGTVAGIFGALSIPVLAVGAALVSVGVAIYRIVDAVHELGGARAVWQDIKDFVSGDGPAVSKGNEGFAAYQAEQQRRLALAHAVSTTSDMSVPAMAAGGIVNRPTLALIGEAGPEAVVPLRGDSTMDDLVGGGRGGGSTTVTIGAMTVHVSSASGDGASAAYEFAQQFRSELGKALAEAGAT